MRVPSPIRPGEGLPFSGAKTKTVGGNNLHRAAHGEANLPCVFPNFPPDMEQEIIAGYQELSRRYGARTTDVAVRSSATAEDLPDASFAGQQES
ncbi:MAG TPA: PEP/pyruvate-binding domain-containing protein, partial [Oscillospiraceae bacterium]|nr:PEP/pyruvate-binding domain-containing protein [Oscillospiraceae bacterium]